MDEHVSQVPVRLCSILDVCIPALISLKTVPETRAILAHVGSQLSKEQVQHSKLQRVTATATGTQY